MRTLADLLGGPVTEYVDAKPAPRCDYCHDTHYVDNGRGIVWCPRCSADQARVAEERATGLVGELRAYSLDTFVAANTGSYHARAIAGALDAARQAVAHPYGMVGWYGGVGTGKTHLLAGVCNALRRRDLAVHYTTTGNLTNIRNNAGFDFGVAMLPAGKQRGTPTGGGNFHVFKRATAEEREAAMKFVKWMTAPQRAAEWAIATGYVAVSPAAWETDTMKKYVADFPAPTVARDQLQYAVAELSTHENQRVTKALNDGLQAALTGTKTPAQAMQDAQREAERILRAYR